MREALLPIFGHLIQETRILTDHQYNQLFEYKARPTLTDSSILKFTEIMVLGIQKRKCSFQRMTGQYELIMRWNNALHHRYIATFPHHKHVGNEQTIEPSEEVFLIDVLKFIRDQIDLR